jgi:hypothetical protein
MENMSPDPDIRKLRRRARTLDVAIRTKRSSRSRPEPTYDLIDLASGQVLSAGLSRSDLASDLARIAEDRGVAHVQRQPEDGARVQAAPPQSGDPTPARADPRPRFCESCGQDQALVAGTLTRTPEGAWVCANCATTTWEPATSESSSGSVDSTPATTRTASARRRALSGQPPLADRRGVVKRSAGARRWIPVSAALLGVATLVVATQQPAFRQAAEGGGVLGETARATSDAGASIAGSDTAEPAASGSNRATPRGSIAASASTTPARSAAPAATAVRVGNGTVTTWTGPYQETRMQVVVPITNEGTDWVALPRSASRYRVLDGGGRELASGLFTIALPGTIGPKETAYLVETVSAVFVAGKGTPTVKADVAAVPATKPAASLRVTDVAATTGPDGGLRVTGVVHNDGQATTGWLVAGGVLVDAKGQPLGAAYDPGRVGPLDPGATATFDTGYPGAPPPGDAGTKLVGVAFEALDQSGS